MRPLSAIACFVALLTSPFAAVAQGCDLLLRDGVFNTFNETSGRRSNAEWHQAWCSGVLTSSNRAGETSLSLELPVKKIPIGLSFGTAQEFQQMYKSQFCGNADRVASNYASSAAFTQTADPGLLSAYVQCKAVEGRGLEARFIPSQDNSVFTLTLRYNRIYDLGANIPPRITAVSFAPEAAQVSCNGGSIRLPLRRPLNLTENVQNLQCERRSDIPLQISINTDAGNFTRELPSRIPPPTQEELVLSGLPAGTVLVLSNEVPLPAGWRVCDGESGTPDLINRVPLGAASGFGAVGDGMLVLPPMTVVSFGEGFNGAVVKQNSPHIGPRQGQSWGPYHPLRSKGSTPETTIGPVLPPHARVLFVCKI